MNDTDTMTFPVKSFPYRVYYADTDAGGVVYYAQYLRMFEQARALYVEDYGLSLKEMEQNNCVFVCRRAEVDYLAPALLEDELAVHTQISELGKAHMTFTYKITCTNREQKNGEENVLVHGVTKMVACKEKDGRILPTRVPAWILTKLEGKKDSVD